MSEARTRVPLAREPLVHFVVLGALLFAANVLFVDDGAGHRPREDASETDAKRIVLSASHRAELAAQWEDRTGRPAREADVERMVHQWIDREILYREAIAMGLHEDDMVVRNQVISKLTVAFQSLAAIPTPSEDQLRAYLASHRELYARPPRYDIVHVFAPSSAREPDPNAEASVRAYLEQIEAGADPLELGPRFAKGRRFRLRTQTKLAAIFGEDFAERLVAVEPGTWVALPSRHGWHGVSITKVHPPTPARFDELRERLWADWEREQRQSDVRRQVLRLREDYEIELPDGTVMRASELPAESVGDPVEVGGRDGG